MECPTPVKQDFWFPLKQFYQRRSLAWVEPEPLAPDAVPEPYSLWSAEGRLPPCRLTTATTFLSQCTISKEWGIIIHVKWF